MPLVAAKCTQCGANIEVDDTKEAGICKYCGTAFITEKAINNYNTYITNNNNFAGANVVIQQVKDNTQGLLRIARRELLDKHYYSNDLLDALKNIIIQSENGEEQIIALFHETGIYKLAEEAITDNKDAHDYWYISQLLEKYDSDNIDGWLMDWKYGPMKSVSLGEKIIQLANAHDKPMYEKEIYTEFLTRGPQCGGYKEYLLAVPREYIVNNKFAQDLILSAIEYLYNHRYIDNWQERIAFLKEILPESRHAEIYKPEPSKGCYVATCVYGSYDCPEVWTLRRFRDYTLDTTWYGRLFIKCYYAISPTIVKWFGDTKWFKAFWKARLDKMVYNLNNKGVENTSYTDKY